ncbi:MAG: hypothetical protein NUV80_02935 [Candidatus Berkelbacteria bacterium]|nr:hypothetical protein [Candidatus Berkelbacteria bacterium]
MKPERIELVTIARLDYDDLLKSRSDLLEACIEAADWLCDSHKGSDQWERGQKCLRAIKKAQQ